VEEIKQLKARYFRSIDTKDWTGLASVFTADATLESEGRVRRGRDDIVSFIARFLDGVVSVHHGHMPEISIDGPHTATGVWAMYVREDDGWRIRRLVLTRIRVDRN